MLSEKKCWTIYMNLLEIFGVLILSKNVKIYKFSLTFFQTITFLLPIFNRNWMKTLEMYGIIGTTTELLQYVLNCVKNEILFCYLYIYSKECKFIANTIFEIEHNIQNFSWSHRTIVQKNFKVLVFLNTGLISSLLLCRYHYFPDLRIMFTNAFGLAMSTYEIDYVRTSLLFTFYVILVSIILDILQRINLRLEWIVVVLEIKDFSNTKYLNEIEFLVWNLNRLLNLCIFKISYIFGFCIIVAIPYMLLEFVQSCFFLTFDMSMENIDYLYKGIVLVWISTKVILYSRIFTCNLIWKQVSLFDIIFINSYN